uniref:Uncharacterized protein n=1 Tax=Bionectria ochroleuca TaxID=29856 RepID=A0A8H7TT34_BIOOC
MDHLNTEIIVVRFAECTEIDSTKEEGHMSPFELVDMYHTRKAPDPLDKVYALLGISSDDPNEINAAGLSVDYNTS